MDPQEIQRRRFLRGQRWTGVFLLGIGAVLMLKQMNYPMPEWLFTWPIALIVLGLFIGIKHRFRDFSWLILIVVGTVFLIDSIHPEYDMKRYAVPGIVIFFGLIFLVAPRTRRFNRRWERHERFHRKFREKFGDFNNFNSTAEPPSAATEPVRAEPDAATGPMDSTVDIVSVFSGIKKKIISKNFRGGEVVCIFGGAELNLTNADFNSPVTIEFVQILGGTKLIVPANWEVKSQIAAIFGGIEDKRPQPSSTVAERTLVLNGTVLFGGVEINSF